MLQTKVKASSVTNLTDARYFAAREVTWLGFNLDEASDTYVSPKMVEAMREWVDGVAFVGEFNIASAATIKEMVEELKLDALQVGMFTNIETLVDLQTNVPVFKELIIEPETSPEFVAEQLELFQPWVRYVILNFTKNNITWAGMQADAAFSGNQLADWCEHYPILLDMNFDKNMLKNLLEALPLQGICVKGGEEEKIGYKSFDELDEIFDILEAPEQF